jgi:hypothetical protein
MNCQCRTKREARAKRAGGHLAAGGSLNGVSSLAVHVRKLRLAIILRQHGIVLQPVHRG